MSATKSKTLATWLAVLFGSLGLHRLRSVLVRG